MTAREFFQSVRQAVLDIERSKQMLEMTRIGISSHGQNRGSETSDPTSQMAQAILDAESKLEHDIQAMESLISEGITIISGVSQGLGAEYALVLQGYYIQAKTWDEVAESCRISRRTVLRNRDIALDWVDGVGFAHAKNGLGIAEI